MASTCMSNCVDARAPVRATYVNLYKWPESDVAFVRSLSLNERSSGGNGTSAAAHRQQPKVVDSISCRQLYLRSYTFSRDDDDDELMDKEMWKRSCLRFRKKVAANKRKREPRGGGGSRRKKCSGFRRAKDMSCVAFSSIFRRLLSCTTKVDVVG